MPPEGKAPAALCRLQLFMAEGRYSACLFFLGAGHSISVKGFFCCCFFPWQLSKVSSTKLCSKHGAFLSTQSLGLQPSAWNGLLLTSGCFMSSFNPIPTLKKKEQTSRTVLCTYAALILHHINNPHVVLQTFVPYLCAGLWHKQMLISKHRISSEISSGRYLPLLRIPSSRCTKYMYSLEKELHIWNHWKEGTQKGNYV